MVEGGRDTLLLVDDDPGIREALSMVLAEEGYEVVTAENGQEALAYLGAHGAPRVILLDLMMPVMDGYEFRAAQRSDPTLSSIPVLVLTAGSMTKHTRTLGADAYFTKPVDLDALLAAIQKHHG